MTEFLSFELTAPIQQGPSTSRNRNWRWVGLATALSLAGHAFLLFLLADMEVIRIEPQALQPPIDTRAVVLDGSDTKLLSIAVYRIEDAEPADDQQGSLEIVNGMLQCFSSKNDLQRPQTYTIWFGPIERRNRGADYAYVKAGAGLDLKRFSGKPVSIRGRLQLAKTGLLFVQAVSLREVSEPADR